MTALIDTLFQLEKQLGLELDSLMPFAEADDLGGYHPDEKQRKWGSGAVWDVEGRTLFALVRALKPHTIVEIGSGTGCSTNHMAQALKDGAIDGHITTVDRGNTPYVAHDLRNFIDVRNDDAINYLALQPDNSIDFLLEDADHSIQLCQAIGELAKTKLKPGGVLIAHDAAHPGVGADVKRGYDLAGLDFRVYLTDPSDCGWAVWKRPELATARVDENGHAEFSVQLGEIDTIFKQAQQDYIASVDAVLNNQPVLQAQEEPNAAPEPPRIIWTSDTKETFDEVKARLIEEGHLPPKGDHSPEEVKKVVRRTRKKAAK